MAARPVPAVDTPTVQADDACAALYRRYGSEILRYCRRRLAEPADAEDVAQQVFVRAYGALLRGERVRLPRHWLLRIARNECRRFVSRRGRVQEVGFDEAIDVTPEEEPARWSPAEIRRALDELVPTQREALILRELEGRPYEEIARELRLSVSAVETLLFRARRSLREQLDGSLACGAAERALSLELDGRLPDTEKSGLRAHLRACDDCRLLARRSRARRRALRTLLPLPLQGQLASLVGGGGTAAGGAAVGTGAVAKALALLAAGAATSTVGLTVALPAAVPERAPTNIVVPTEDPGTPTVRVQAAPAAIRSRAGATPAAVANSATPSAPVAVTTSATAPTTTVTTAPAAAPASAPATAATAGQEPLTAVASTVDETVGTVEDTVDTLVPTVTLPQPQLPPVQPPALPVEPPPLPTVPELPPLDPDLPDLPG